MTEQAMHLSSVLNTGTPSLYLTATMNSAGCKLRDKAAEPALGSPSEPSCFIPDAHTVFSDIFEIENTLMPADPLGYLSKVILH